MKYAYQTIEVSFIFLASIILLASRWMSYVSASSSINQLDTDFLYFDVIHRNPTEYANVLIAGVVGRVSESFGTLIGLSHQLSNLGIDQNAQLIGFFFAQLLLGIAGIHLILTGLKFGAGERLLVFAFFLFSYFTQFGRYLGGPGFYNKVTASCMAIGFGYLVVGLFITGRFRLSIATASALAYLHPVYSAILLLLNAAYGAKVGIWERGWTKKYGISFFALPLLILGPLVYGLLDTPEVVFGGTTQLWWDFLKSKTSNPFPLQDGLIVAIPSLLTFWITFYLLGKQKTPELAQYYQRAQWIVAGVIAAWIVQIVFTEVFPVAFIARLSLTRTTPFALLFMIIVYVGIAWRYRERDETGLWLVLLTIPAILGASQLFQGEAVRHFLSGSPLMLTLLGGHWPDFSIFPETLLMFVLLAVLAGTGRQNRLHAKARQAVQRVAATIAVFLLAALLISQASTFSLSHGLKPLISFFAGTILLIWLTERLFFRLSVTRQLALLARKHSSVVALLLAATVILPHAIVSVKKMANPPPALDEGQRMWNYIERNTEKNEMILVVPLFESRRFPIMPLRPIFVDWADTQYVLYDPSMLQPLLARLSLMGLDLEQALLAESCVGVMQYADPMCKRKLFESISENYSDVWRENITEMREIAPNLSYVLIRSRHVIAADRVVYRTGNVSLIKL